MLLNSVKSTEISALLKSLDLDQRDTLMKWIYKGLARPELGAGGVLLGWHEKVSVGRRSSAQMSRGRRDEIEC